MGERACKCGHTPSEVEEAFLSESVGLELSYASAKENEYMAPLVRNLIPIPIPAPCHLCVTNTKTYFKNNSSLQ